MALAEYYTQKGMIESALRTIEQSRDIEIVGDTSYLMANILFKKEMKKEAVEMYQQCLEQ